MLLQFAYVDFKILRRSIATRQVSHATDAVERPTASRAAVRHRLRDYLPILLIGPPDRAS